MILGAKLAGTLIYFIPAGVNFFLSAKPMISFYYINYDTTWFCGGRQHSNSEGTSRRDW
jgi:hypothetical protein